MYLPQDVIGNRRLSYFVEYGTVSIDGSYKVFLIFISNSNAEAAEPKAVLSHAVKREAFSNMGNDYSY